MGVLGVHHHAFDGAFLKVFAILDLSFVLLHVGDWMAEAIEAFHPIAIHTVCILGF